MEAEKLRAREQQVKGEKEIQDLAQKMAEKEAKWRMQRNEIETDRKREGDM